MEGIFIGNGSVYTMIALACDHTGVALKQELMKMLDEMGLAWKDFGN